MDDYTFLKYPYITDSVVYGLSRAKIEDGLHRSNPEHWAVSKRKNNKYFNYLISHEVSGDNFIDRFFGDYHNTWEFTVSFGEKTTQFLQKTCDFLNSFEDNSIINALGNNKYLSDFILAEINIKRINYKGYEVSPILCEPRIHVENKVQELTSTIEAEISTILYDYAEHIHNELKRFTLDTSKLVRRKCIEETQLPGWLKTSINVGKRIGAKALCAYIGTSIDLPDMFDSDSNYDLGDFGDTTLDYDLDISEIGSDIDNYNNVTFRGNNPPNANSDGYIPDGQVTLERTISGTTNTFKCFTKDGHDFVYKNGQYIRIDGSGTVTINNIKYDKK